MRPFLNMLLQDGQSVVDGLSSSFSNSQFQMGDGPDDMTALSPFRSPIPNVDKGSEIKPNSSINVSSIICHFTIVILHHENIISLFSTLSRV